ncbi:MAG: hypothetical protein MJ102_07280 [Clostridia bacterium]|nr:hypothetical protein [Clostridia bacterium]
MWFTICITMHSCRTAFMWQVFHTSLAFVPCVISRNALKKKQDSMMENAAFQIRKYLSGQRDERIECNEEGELFFLFQSVNTLSAILNAQTEREKQTNYFLKSMISDISHQLKTPLFCK